MICIKKMQKKYYLTRNVCCRSKSFTLVCTKETLMSNRKILREINYDPKEKFNRSYGSKDSCAKKKRQRISTYALIEFSLKHKHLF